jgi:threonine dehydrogenase-like Zn-dependent dehydrogenase
MKALIVPARGQLVIDEIAPPEPGPYDALVRITVCGICNSTDRKLIDGTMAWAPPVPFVLGHEAVGTVVAVGPHVRSYKVGDLVNRPVAFWPGTRPDLNVAMGGFAEYGLVRDSAAMAADGDASLLSHYLAQRQVVLPATLTPLDAALAISLSETASVLRHLPNVRGKTVVVAGTGIAGLALSLWAKLAGAFVVVVGRRDERLAHAQQVGADVTVNTTAVPYLDALRRAGGGAVDVIIEATGDAALATTLEATLAADGIALAYGVPPTGTTYGPRWVTADVEEHLSLPWVADLLSRGWVRPAWFVSHTWRFDEAPEAFRSVARGEVIKGFVVLHDVPAAQPAAMGPAQ